MKQCSQCKMLLQEEDEYCPQCGAAQPVPSLDEAIGEPFSSPEDFAAFAEAANDENFQEFIALLESDIEEDRTGNLCAFLGEYYSLLANDPAGGSAENKRKAVYYLELGEQRNHAEAILELGNVYYTGFAGETDWVKAVTLWTRAAQLGNRRAAYLVGMAYYQGLGVPRSCAEAKKWLSMAPCEASRAALQEIQAMEANQQRFQVPPGAPRYTAAPDSSGKQPTQRKKKQKSVRCCFYGLIAAVFLYDFIVHGTRALRDLVWLVILSAIGALVTSFIKR